MSSRKNSPALSALTTAITGRPSTPATSTPPNVATCHNRGESGDDTHLSPAITQQITAAPHFNSKTAATNRPPIDPIFLAHEVCAHMRIGRTTLHKIVKSGELVPLRVGARVRAWRLSAIEAYLASKEAK